ncbi:MAG: dihydrofolate reductase [Betaproteobacteria bacterium]|nr:dihydrofolate reductase [Betaproteobacteria bacterium]
MSQIVKIDSIRPPPVVAGRPLVVLIAAVAANGSIGRDNRMPWRLPEDLKRFKALTLGHPVLMGRRTWESIGKPLPGRENIVLTRSANFSVPGCRVAHSMEEALESCRGKATVFVIGGVELYGAALPLASRLLLTEIRREFPGDAFFPAFDRSAFREVSRHRNRSADGLEYDFVEYQRL